MEMIVVYEYYHHYKENQHLYNLLEKHTHTHTHICERNLFRITFSSRTCCCFLNFTSTFL